MKKLFLILAAIASLSACASFREVSLNVGTNELDTSILPYGNGELIGFETLMISGGGSTSLNLGKKISGTIPHTDITTYYGYATNVFDSYYVTDYKVDMVFSNRTSGALISSVCYTNSSYSDLYKHDTIGYKSGRFNLSGTVSGMSLSIKTNFNLSTFEVLESGTWSGSHISYPMSPTNFVWQDDGEVKKFCCVATNMARTVSYWFSCSFERVGGHMNQTTNVVRYIDHVTTNKWTEYKSRILETQIIPVTQLTNSVYINHFSDPVYLFAGDILNCTAPITTNNPGQIRAIIRDDSAGTLRPFHPKKKSEEQ